MNRFLENLQAQAEENPVVALGIGAALITAITKLIDSTTHVRNSSANAKNARSWDRETKRRKMQAKRNR